MSFISKLLCQLSQIGNENIFQIYIEYILFVFKKVFQFLYTSHRHGCLR